MSSRSSARAVLAALLLAHPVHPQDPDPEPAAVLHRLPTPEEIADLPPDGGPAFNRLVFERSPYLLQHARNPVDWYPWGEEAFARARAEDKPVFLSVGYSTCHWCHVMERESFEDEQVAALMNEHFVCIKVDREERPDVDQVYMTVTQAMTGRGGWPMTVLLTPDAKPFFAGTYFPKRGRGGMRGMLELLPLVAETWRERRADLAADAERVTAHVARSSGGAPGGELGRDVLERAFRDLSRSFDETSGGFLPPPKFPRPHDLRFLLRWARRTGDDRALEMVEDTLRALRRGGIFDQVGLGLHRYSTDAEWLVPHFEKMLYDQALVAMAWVEAWQWTQRPEHRAAARDVLDYVLRDLAAPGGGFWSAEDADSEGEEGLFYLWTAAELEEALEPEDAPLAKRLWGVTDEGNFLQEATGRRTGRSILHRDASLEALAAELELEPDALAARVEAMRARLLAARSERVRPFLDDKVLTDWNGLAIAALADAGRAFGEERYVRAAERAAEFLLRELRDERGRVLKTWRGGSAALPGMLDDHAFAAWGMVELYEATFEPRWLRAALDLVRDLRAHFEDREGGGFFTAPDDGERLIVRAKDPYDGALPSGNSVAAWVLLRLARLTGDPELEECAHRTLAAFSGAVAASPRGFTHMLLAADMALGPTREVVVAGRRGDAGTRAMLDGLARLFLPNTSVVFRPAGEAEPGIDALVPSAREFEPRGERATAWVCRDYACDAPTEDPDELLRRLSPGR